MNPQFVIAKIEHTGHHPRRDMGPNSTVPQHLLMRWGYCDFANDGKFNATNEDIIGDTEYIAPPDNDISKTDTYWNSTSEEWQDTQPT